MQVLADSPLFARADIQYRRLQPFPFSDIRTSRNDIGGFTIVARQNRVRPFDYAANSAWRDPGTFILLLCLSISDLLEISTKTLSFLGQQNEFPERTAL